MSAFPEPGLAVAPGLHAAKAGALRRRIQPGWQADAACADTDDPEAWFPDRTARPDDVTEPLAICAACPVRRSCLAAGLLGREYGLWGGTTDTQRDAALGAAERRRASRSSA
jgi:hypothetical protein